MAFASAASDRPAIADINVTPLVDVMLVLLIEVERGDVLRLEGQAYAPATLQAELARRQAQVPELVLKIAVDPQADYQGATNALAAAERAGVANISIE